MFCMLPPYKGKCHVCMSLFIMLMLWCLSFCAQYAFRARRQRWRQEHCSCFGSGLQTNRRGKQSAFARIDWRLGYNYWTNDVRYQQDWGVSLNFNTCQKGERFHTSNLFLAKQRSGGWWRTWRFPRIHQCRATASTGRCCLLCLSPRIVMVPAVSWGGVWGWWRDTPPGPHAAQAPAAVKTHTLSPFKLNSRNLHLSFPRPFRPPPLVEAPVTRSWSSTSWPARLTLLFLMVPPRRTRGPAASAGQRHAGRDRHVSTDGGDGEAGGAARPGGGEGSLLHLHWLPAARRGEGRSRNEGRVRPPDFRFRVLSGCSRSVKSVVMSVFIFRYLIKE